jgi:hypothetical protein
VLLLTGCSLTGIPGTSEGCKIRTYIDLGLVDYISNRYNSQQLPRIAVIPFDVPETFSPAGNQKINFGRDLANLFQHELLRRGELGIVELFDRDRWPGKRAEFFTGNYTAIQLARNAGYDFVVVGYMKDIINESDLTMLTRVVDTSNSITVWYAKTTISSNARVLRRTLSDITRGWIIQDKPDLFAFPERADLFASCTADRLIRGKPVEDESILGIDQTERRKEKVPL